MLGYIYGANVGWINLGDGTPANGTSYTNTSATDFGVNCSAGAAGEKNLRGFAYGANIGWVNFEATGNPRVILNTGRLRGYVWSANSGWINLEDANVYVATAPQASPTPTATATATPTELPPEPGLMQGAAGVAGWLAQLAAAHRGDAPAELVGPTPSWI